MDKYKLVKKERQPAPEGEIRVTAVGRVAAYVSYIAKLLVDEGKDKVEIKAQGNALAKAVTLAEVAKRRIKGLHQITKVGSSEIEDEYEPLEEGLDKVVTKRFTSVVEITLSKTALDTSALGYQAPLPEDQVKEVDLEELSRPRGRKGGGKGPSKGKGKGDKGKGKGKGKGDKGKGKGKGDKGKGKGYW
mmetsp:Transcript_35196/g.78849  ORF Transcript_35196/g.78849 Transcript_35196/m.78849 type:complete len:189 (-) Transcript_35196:241-807(-)